VEHVSIEAWAAIATAVATMALVFLLWRTIKQFEATVEVSRIQTEYRFRPWIGPVDGIKKMDHSINEKCQFDIGIKNYGELPAAGVTAKFKMNTSILKREDTQSSDLETFDLGPMLPNMEKHYWFFIEPELWKKALEGKEKLFTILYFEYETAGAKSGYGMISEYNSSSQNFVHRDMWIGDEKLNSHS
jgi:hypothetical protein